MAEKHTRQNQNHGNPTTEHGGPGGPTTDVLNRRLRGKVYPMPKGKTPTCPDHPGRNLSWDERRGLWFHWGSRDCWTYTPAELADARQQ